MARDVLDDMRMDVFNCLFRVAERPCDPRIYTDVVKQLLKHFDDSRHLMTREMLLDQEWGMEGTRGTLEKLLTHHQTDRFRNRIVRIASLVTTKLDQPMRATLLASWAAAGYHCSTRAEEETYKFYMLNTTDAKSMDEEGHGLEMRIAIYLAELRKACLA